MKLLWKAKMSTIQEGGEEVEEGAVYNVTLKRVQIQQAANKGARWLGAGGDQLPPEHTVRQYETCKIRTIKAGTLEKLVENLLTAFGDNDFTYISIFLSTYRAFASTKVVLELLLDRYGNLDALSYGDESRNSTKSRMVVKSAITSIVRAWIDQCSEDFRELPDFPCLLKLLDYLKTNMPGSDTEKRAQNLLEQFQNQEAENDNAFNNIFPFNLSNEEELEITPDEFSFFQEDFVAEQLTYMDAELFKKVVPYHCLGSIWSRRDRKENEHLVPTIRATISQFNAVTNCVVSTILINKELKIQQRAKIVEKWIHIAHECRILKNFSSLRAIISALQSSSIYQLKKTWACIPKDAMQIFEELSDIFSDHYNYLTSREILMKEGTSKFANLDGSVKENQKRTQRRLQLQKDMGVIQGTVPYLGTFLTDLVMLDAAIQDHIEGGLINFEKRRKEFEIIAQIKLLQSACNSYCMTPDQKFIQWFRRQHHLTEEESYSLSREVETAADTSTISPKSQNSMVKRLSLLFLGSEVATQSTPIKGQSKSTPSGSAGESTNSASVLTCKAMIHSPPVKEEPKSTPNEKVGESTDSSCKVMAQSTTIKKQPKSTPSGSAGESTNSASVLTCKAMIHSPPVKEEPKSTPSGSAGKTTNSASVLTRKAMIHSPPVKEEPKSTPSGSAGESTNSASVLTCKAMIHSPLVKEEPKSTPSGKVGESTDSSCKVMTQSTTIKKQPKSTPSGSAGKSTNSASVSSCQVMTQSTPIKEEPKSTPSGSAGKSTNSARVLTCKAMIHSPPIKEEPKSTPSGSAGESTNSASVLTCKAMIHSPPVKEEPKSTPSGSAGESTDSSCKVMTQSTTIKKQPKSTPSGSTGESTNSASVSSCQVMTQSTPIKEEPKSTPSGSTGKSTNSARVLTCKAMIHSPPIKEEPKSTPSGSAGEGTKSASVLSPELNHLESGDVCISPVGTPDKFQIKTSESSSSFTISIGTSSSLPSVVSTPSILNSSSSDLDSVSATPKTSKIPPLVNSAQSPEVRIIRVSVQNNKGNVYKSILITNQERTPAVIEKAMLKHDLHFGTADDYELVQIISEDKELVLPHNTNVFYSMNSRVKFNFILRERQLVRRKVKQKHSFFPSFPRKRRGWGNSHRTFAL